MKVKATLLTMLVLLMACSQVDEHDMARIEGSNGLAYRLRYSDVSASLKAAKQALALSEGDPDGKAEALNNMAYVAYQQMKFDQSLHLLGHVHAFSRNQIELLCADVLTMKIMQRIGRGKDFFDARLRAGKRLSRILSEENQLSEHQNHRLHYALTEFHIVASTYYYYLGQDSAARSEIQEASRYVNLDADTTQWLYYQYMLGSGGLIEGLPEEVTVAEFNHLFRVYTLAKANGYKYFEANALQSLSAMIADSVRAMNVLQQRADAYAFLYGEHLRWQTDDLPSPRMQFAAALSRHSIALFRQYKDLFQTACALRTLGEVYFTAGSYHAALASFGKALHLARDHSRSPYQVTPWLAGIHENLSLTYSALGDKASADVHRNTYLDLLDESRQNKELDSRKALLKQEARSEQIQFVLLLLLVVLVVVLAYLYSRQLRNRSRSFEKQVREIASSHESRQALLRLEQLQQESDEHLEESREEGEVAAQRLLAQQQRHILQRTKLSVAYAIIPYLDRLIAEVKKLDEMGENASPRLSYIQELCAGMMVVNDRLTSWIQMQQGRLSLHVSRFPLNDVFSAVAMQQSSFAQQQINLEVPATDLQIKADKTLTLFMVNTLLDNARKFTPAGGKVTIMAHSIENYVEISVKDTGVGLSKADVQTLNDSKVYDPSRIGSTKAGKGFGFGIMNCKGIINSYKKLSALFSGCDFGVESTEGQGSRFWFRLPRVLSLLLFCALSLSMKAMPQRCYELYDSTFAANLQGRYAEAYAFSAQAISEVEAPVDTPLLVSLFNEQAIAAQALGDWEAYRESNAECVRLHRLYSTDGTLASDCQRLEKMTSDSRVLYVLIVLLLIASLALFYRIVLRSRLRHRASLDDIYRQLVAALQSYPQNATAADVALQGIADHLEQPQMKQPVLKLKQTLAEGMEKVRRTEENIREAEDKTQRQRFEHDRLYVMNQILDNALSTIKHETMYFPSRIKQLADEMQQTGVDAASHRNLLDLTAYYRHIYMLLYEQAQRQTDQSPLRLQVVEVSRLFAYAESKGIKCNATNLKVKGDEMQLRLLIDQLQAVALANAALEVEQRNSMIYIICSAEGQKLTQEQLSSLFSPQTERLEYLVMRQVVREHDAACGHPGLRLVAENTERGYRILFSLPAAS